MRPVEPLHVALVENRLQGTDRLEARAKLVEERDFQDPRVPGGLVGVFLEDVPGGEREVGELGQGHEVLDHRGALFRPLSEMNGGWFWHGSKRRAEYISLWRDLHDEFTFARGLTNLLWVYESDAALAHVFGGATNSSGTMVDYYFPGDDLVDIAGHNFYDDDWMLAFDSDAISHPPPGRQL